MNFIIFLLLFIFSFPQAVLAGAAAPQAKKRQQQQMMMHQQQNQQALRQKQMASREGPSSAPDLSEEELGQIWEMLKSSSQAWHYISDDNIKKYFVSQYINLFHQKGIKIKKSARYYVQMINDMANKTPQMLSLPFIKIVQIVAVMEYDFDMGRDRDILAREILGEDAYIENRKRLGLE